MDAEGLETYADELFRAARGWSDTEDLAQETLLAAGRGRMVCSATNKHYDLLRRKYGPLPAGTMTRPEQIRRCWSSMTRTPDNGSRTSAEK